MDCEAQNAAYDENYVDGRTAAGEEATDKQLPKTSGRNVKWWNLAFYNVAAMLGPGVLSLSHAMSQLGWVTGVAVLVSFWILPLFTAWQMVEMVEMHEMVPGKRFDTNHVLSQYVFGENLGFYLVLLHQMTVDFNVNIVYMVTGGKSMQNFYNTVCNEDCIDMKLTYFIMIFASVQFVLSHLRFIPISWFSSVAGFMSLSYSTLVWLVLAYRGVQPDIDVDYGYKAMTTTAKVLDSFSALGIVAFAYSGHNVIMELQASSSSTPEKPSKSQMWKGLLVAFIVVAVYYFPVGLVGYWKIGNSVSDNILISLEGPKWLIAVTHMFVIFHVTLSYQIHARPAFDEIENGAVKGLNSETNKVLRFITRNMYVALTMLIAIIFPFFGGLLGFFGGFTFAPTKYILPCVTWLRIRKPKRYSMSWFINWICIFMGVCLMILPALGGLWQIALQA